MDSTETDITEPITAEETGNYIWTKLLEWLNGGDDITPEVRELFVEKSTELRLRMQAVFMELQRQFLNQVAAESAFEDHLRRDIRANLPYMSAKEKLDALKILQASTDVRMQRLESQLAGFDFFNTIQVSVQSMTDTKVSKDLAQSVKQIPSARRQALLVTLNSMLKQLEEPLQAVVEETPDTKIHDAKLIDPRFSD